MNKQYEDESRYTAPPDPVPEPEQYNLRQILDYVRSAIPHEGRTYSMREIEDILRSAAADIDNEDYGIQTI